MSLSESSQGVGLGSGSANLEVVVVSVESMVLDELRQVVGSGLGHKVHDGHVPVVTEGHCLRQRAIDDARVAWVGLGLR